MRILSLFVRVLPALASIQGASALPNPNATKPNDVLEGDDHYDEITGDYVELVVDDPPNNVAGRATPATTAALGKLAQDLIMSTTSSVLAGALLNALGGSSNVVRLSEESLERISDLVKENIEAAWYERDKADSTTFLQIASLYDRRSGYNFTSPDPDQFDLIDADRLLAQEYGHMGQRLLNRIVLYGLKGAPLFQVLVGTWVSFRREQILLSQLLDDINKAQGKPSTMAVTARQSFRSDCQAMSEALVQYRDVYKAEIPPLYFYMRDHSRVVSSHIISCRETVVRWVWVKAFNRPIHSKTERENEWSDLNWDYTEASDNCRMNKCHPSSAGKACWNEKREWGRQHYNRSVEDWGRKVQGEYLTDHIDANIDSLLSIHNGTLPL